MKIEELVVGGRYRLIVSSAIGYDDYFYTGDTHPNPEGGLLYCFEGTAGHSGYYWFDAKDIEEMEYIETDYWRVLNKAIKNK